MPRCKDAPSTSSSKTSAVPVPMETDSSVPAKSKGDYSQKKLSAYQKFVAERLRTDPNIRRLPNNKRLAAVSALWKVHKRKSK